MTSLSTPKRYLVALERLMRCSGVHAESTRASECAVAVLCRP